MEASTNGSNHPHPDRTDKRIEKVIQLSKEGRSVREIAKEVHMSFRDISDILKEARGKGSSTVREPNEKTTTTPSADSKVYKAYELFEEGKTPIQVSIALSLRENEVTIFCKEFWKLKRLNILTSLHDRIGDKGIAGYLALYRRMQSEGMMDFDKFLEALSLVQTLADTSVELQKVRANIQTLRINEQKTIERTKALEEKRLHLEESVKQLALDEEARKQMIAKLSLEKQQLLMQEQELRNRIASLQNDQVLVRTRRKAEMQVREILSSHSQLLQYAFDAVITAARKDPRTLEKIASTQTASRATQTGQRVTTVMPDFALIGRAALLDTASLHFEMLVNKIAEEAISTVDPRAYPH